MKDVCNLKAILSLLFLKTNLILQRELRKYEMQCELFYVLHSNRQQIPFNISLVVASTKDLLKSTLALKKLPRAPEFDKIEKKILERRRKEESK